MELKASANRIESLPDSFPKLTRLRDLRLTDNRLSKLPDCSQLPLTTLHLGGNRISAVPSWLLELPTLTDLEFSGNVLEIPLEISQGGLPVLREFLGDQEQRDAILE